MVNGYRLFEEILVCCFLLQGMYQHLEVRGSVVVKATSRKVAGPIPIEVIFSIYLILPAALGPEVYSAYNRNEYRKQKKMFLESRALPVRRADSLTAFCEPTVRFG
jgi:hypothetical protein